jgi:streptogramin lyase
MRRDLAAIVCGLLILGGFASGAVGAPSVTPGPIVLVSPTVPCTLQGGSCLALSLTGSGFGAATGASSLLIWNDPGFAPVSVPATDPNVLLWNDDRIVVAIATSIDHPTGIVITQAGGSSNRFTAERWTYQPFSTLAGGGTNQTPNFLTTDGFSTGWLVEEFGAFLKWWILPTGVVSRIALPACADNCFRTGLHSGTTKLSDTSEDVTLAHNGKVWFTQGGRWDLDVAQTPVGNHSRVLSYEPQPFFPGSGTFRIHNVPGDRNSVFPVAWDRVHGRIWFTERPRPGIRPTSRIVSFDPAGINGRPGQPANNFNFTAAAQPCVAGFCSNAPTQACETNHDCVLADQICPANAQFLVNDADCFHTYPVPDSAWVFGLLPAPSGEEIWFADWFTSDRPYLGRLDAHTGAITRFPVRPVEPIVDGLYRLAPAANGDVLFVRLLVNGIGRFDVSRAADPVCQTLVSPNPSVDCETAPDSSCANPCMREVVPIPGYEGATSPVQVQIQEISEDPGGNLWFTQFSQLPGNFSLNATVGYWKADRSGVALFPPFALFPAPSACPTNPGFQAVGVNAAENGDVWFADYCRNQLGRLRKLGL